MKFKNVMGYTIVALLLLLTSCNSEEALLNDSTEKTTVQTTVCGEATTVSLIAGQHIDVGTVTVSNDETYLYVTYETSGDWYLTETHVYVGDENAIPLNGGGNPRIGHFYSEDHGNVSTYTYTFDLDALSDSFVVVAHAVVDSPTNESETAFGCGDKEFPGNRWGCYFDYEKQECEDECLDVVAVKENLRQSICLNSGFGWSGWFFSYYIQEQTAGWRGYSLMHLYANVGDGCDVTEAVEVGRIEIRAVDGGFSFTYVLNAGYGLDEVNLYAGDHDFIEGTDTVQSADYDGSVSTSDPIFIPWTGDDLSQIFVSANAKVCTTD